MTSDIGFLSDADAQIEQYHASVRRDLLGIPEERIWDRPVPGQVSPANMVLHLTGNLKHFFGHLLGDSDYERDRDREFLHEPTRNREEILTAWDEACHETRTVLSSLTAAALDHEAPVTHYPGGVPVHTYILRLLTHLAYHAGQVRSHLRMLGLSDTI
jgi:hypothetical protein